MSDEKQQEEYLEGEFFGQKIKTGGKTGAVPEILKWLLIIGFVGFHAYNTWTTDVAIKSALKNHTRQLRNNARAMTYEHRRQEYANQLESCIRTLSTKYEVKDFEKILENWSERSRRYYCPYIGEEPKLPEWEVEDPMP